MNTMTPKPPRTRTAYQTATVKAIRAFCPPRRKPKEKKLSNTAQSAFLLPPWETILAPNGNVIVIWFAVRLKPNPVNALYDYPRNWLDYGRTDEARQSNAAFGVFLDWCDERGLKYERKPNRDLPNAKYRFRHNSNYGGHHFRVTVPRKGA